MLIEKYISKLSILDCIQYVVKCSFYLSLPKKVFLNSLNVAVPFNKSTILLSKTSSECLLALKPAYVFIVVDTFLQLTYIQK